MNWKFWQKKKVKKEEDFTNIKNGKTSNLKNNKTGQVTESALEYNHNNRYLKLNDNDCALVMHEGQKVEIIFTKLYDSQNQEVTPNEQTLMALGVFLRQPGFAELIRHEFNRIATRNIDQLIKEKEDNK